MLRIERFHTISFIYWQGRRVNAPQPILSPLKAARRARIVAAALQVFLATGYRGATMEGVAAAAGLSKVTLYGYFPDKDAVFAAVAQVVLDRLRDAAFTALAAPGPVADRIAAALVAKHGLFHDLVRASAFAADLLANRDRVRDQAAALDDALIHNMAALLGDDRQARLIFHAAKGVAEAASDRAGIGADIRTLVAALAGIAPA